MDNANSIIQDITSLGKRKRDEQTDFDKIPTIFGIVTTGILWQFIQKIEITKVYNCGLDAEFGKKDEGVEKVKEILFYIIRVLQAQAIAVKNMAKRQRTEE